MRSSQDIHRLQRLKQLAHWMDELITIPGLRYRVGLDGLIGLIPGLGDFIGLIISSFFIFTAAQMKVPKVVLVRMFMNVLIESVVGVIPVLGDAFDFVWKANKKNLILLEKSLMSPGQVKRRSLGFLLVLSVALVTLSGGVAWGFYRLLVTIFGALN